MRKKEIEKIPYLGLKKINRKKDVKYIGVTAVKIVGNKKHLFLEVYKNKKESKMVPVVRIILTEKEFWNYFPETEQWTRQKVEKDGGHGDWGRKSCYMGADGKRKCPPEHGGSGKNKEILQDKNTCILRGALVAVHLQVRG